MSSRVFFSRLACTLGHIWRRAIYKTLSIYHDERRESLAWVSSGLRIILGCLQDSQNSSEISFRILAIVTVMNSLTRDRDHPHPDVSGVCPGLAHDVSTHEIPTVFTPRYRPGARKTRIILRAVTGIVSHDNHNGTGLWLVSDLTHWPLIGWYCPHVSLDMHITLSLPLSSAQHHSLVSYPSPEHWTCWLHS